MGTGDVDGGLTSVQSPAIALPAGGTVTLRFRYFYAHNDNASTSDVFRVRVVGSSGTPQTVFQRREGGTVVGGAWTTRTVNLSGYAGQTIRLRFEAADLAEGRIIVAGFDNVTVTRQ